MSATSTSSKASVRIVLLALVFALIAAACSSSADDVSILGGDDSGTTDRSTAGEEVIGESVRFGFDNFDGESILFADFAEGPVVINFFATWCATCVAELPDFETVSQDFAGEVQFLGLSFQDRPEDSLELLERTGVTFPTGLDTNGAVFQKFGGLGMPTTVFIDADGQVVNVHSGVLDVDSLTEAIEEDLLS